MFSQFSLFYKLNEKPITGLVAFISVTANVLSYLQHDFTDFIGLIPNLGALAKAALLFTGFRHISFQKRAPLGPAH